jgi:hypothetical protein
VLVPADKLLGGDGNEAAPLYYICETSKETGTTARRIRTGLCRMFLYPCCVVCVLRVCVCVVCFAPRGRKERRAMKERSTSSSLAWFIFQICVCAVFCAVCRMNHRLLRFRPMWGKGGKVIN